MKGVIFDFNGTMFHDSPLHMEAWRKYLKRFDITGITDEELQKDFMGKSNPFILEHCFGKGLSPEDVDRMGREKEACYREVCFSHPDKLHFAPGLTELLNGLAAQGIPMAIGTSSEINNVNFYFDTFGLEKWFPRDHVVYDDGTLKGKPEPDIYLRILNILGVDGKDCVCFEDSYSGLTSASRAGIGRIIGINSNGDRSILENFPGIDCVADDFLPFTVQNLTK